MIKKTHNSSTDVEREEEDCIRDDGWTYQLGECTLTVVGCLVVWLFGCLVVWLLLRKFKIKFKFKFGVQVRMN